MMGLPRGLSLLELVIALALSALLMSLLMQAVMATRQTLLRIDQLSELSEQGALATQQLAEAVAEAGRSVQCAGQPSWRIHLNLAAAAGTPLASLAPVQAASPALIARREPQSDVLLLRQSLAAGADQLRACDVLLISDCTHSELFQYRDDGACRPGNLDLPWRQTWQGSVQRRRLEWVAWYIREDVDGEPALYSTRFVRGLGHRATAAEVAGIERLRVQYALKRDDGQLSEWLDAEAVTDWRQVVAVRLAVVARSRTVGTAAHPTTAAKLWGEPLLWPQDGRRRQVFERTVVLDERWPN